MTPALAAPIPSDGSSPSAITTTRAPVTNPRTGQTHTPTGIARPISTTTGDPAVAAYWTLRRLAAAIPADTLYNAAVVEDHFKGRTPTSEPLTVGSPPVAPIKTQGFRKPHPQSPISRKPMARSFITIRPIGKTTSARDLPSTVVPSVL